MILFTYFKNTAPDFFGAFLFVYRNKLFAGKGWLCKSEQDEMGRVVSMNHPYRGFLLGPPLFLEGSGELGQKIRLSAMTVPLRRCGC